MLHFNDAKMQCIIWRICTKTWLTHFCIAVKDKGGGTLTPLALTLLFARNQFITHPCLVGSEWFREFLKAITFPTELPCCCPYKAEMSCTDVRYDFNGSCFVVWISLEWVIQIIKQVICD